MVPVIKPNGSVRICVDLKRLNSHVKRAHYPLPAVEDTLARLAKSKVFSTLDTNSGFWQIPVSPDSARLTTFITPFGRFHFQRLPFGITPEIFQRRLKSLLAHVDGVEVFIDDILVHTTSLPEHDKILAKVRATLQQAGIPLNDAKCHLRQSEIKYLGHQVTPEGIRPHPAKLRAIAELKEPANVEELRRVLGLFTYLSRFLPDMATVAAPLRLLLRNEAAWTWSTPQQHALAKMKHLAASAPCLAFFEPGRTTAVTADASGYGLDGALLQEHNGMWKPFAYASHSLTQAETRYAQIEKELLASVWGCEHFHQYLFRGPCVTVQMDHKPLVPFINTRDLDRAPIRCQRLLIRLLRYQVQAVYVPGKSMTVADTLSRAPLPTDQEDDVLQQETTALIYAVTRALCSPEKQRLLVDATTNDPMLQRVVHYTVHGWPTTIADGLREYHGNRDLLSHHEGLFYHGKRLVIPPVARDDTLVQLHKGHQGIRKCKARAQEAVWWPGINASICTYVENCEACIKQRYQPPEPLQPPTPLALPWQKLAIDLCEFKQQRFLVTVDYFSRFIDIQLMNSTTCTAVVKALCTLFATHGIPQEVVSDNGPQFASGEFKPFAEEYNFKHRTSSPHHPQSNGEAERAVQTAKKLLKTEPDLQAALLAYRATPLANGYSPAQLLYGRRVRTTLPIATQQLQPHWPDLDNLQQREGIQGQATTPAQPPP